MSSSDTVGTLLAAIANLLVEGLRIISFTDKRQWGQDEHEQARALELMLDEAKKDFQELSPLVNGQVYYESDRRFKTIDELRSIRAQVSSHIQSLRDWSRAGGHINPIWIRETHQLQRDLHRAQCRAARRIFATEKENTARCLGAFLVHRKQREWANNRAVKDVEEYQRRYLEELVMCNTVGAFQRFGEHDIAFVCDYCDGHIVWEDLETMPSIRTAQETAATPISPYSPATNTPHWQATGFTVTGHQEKQIIFAPIAIANHVAPEEDEWRPADWQTSFLCPFCEVESGVPQEEYEDDDPDRPDLNSYDDLAAFQEHLEWQHTAAPPQTSLPVSAPSASSSSCLVM